MLDFLRQEGINENIISRIEEFRSTYPMKGELSYRVPKPKYRYYGSEVWEAAITALLSGENLLLVGPKATGKNVLAENLAAVFGRPGWDISFYLNTDAASLIGTDTFKNGEVTLRHGPIFQCAENGGFGVLDEINMAKMNRWRFCTPRWTSAASLTSRVTTALSLPPAPALSRL